MCLQSKPPDPGAREVSVHPPHLLDSQGHPTPAALIPFCAYRGNLATLGEPVGGLEFPTCDKFQPTLLSGQLCYSLNISSVVSTEEKKTESGKKKGILFAVDLTDDRIYEGKEENKSGIYVYPDSSDDDNTFSVHINTLSRISDTRPGLYVMTDMKKMTGTESFLALPDETKDCQLEPQDECKRRKYAEEAEQLCACVPWVLGPSLPEKVGTWSDASLHPSGCVLLHPKRHQLLVRH
jgi:hypothetical protein